MFEQMAMSIGWNPYYKNTTKTIVRVAFVHILYVAVDRAFAGNSHHSSIRE